jgi:peptidoglycan-N-acetylglucosamine deacetylase
MRILLLFITLFVIIIEPVEAPLSQNATSVTSLLDPQKKLAYLTFDDGPSLNTIPILDILDRYNIKATFFVIGHNDANALTGYREIVKRGHAIGLHSYSHDYGTIYKSPDGYFDDMKKLEKLLKKEIGTTTKIIRFPGGSRNITTRQSATKGVVDDIASELREKGYIYCDWNVDSKDGFSPNVSQGAIVSSVLKGARGKQEAVVLLHDISNMKNTVRALPALIEGLKSQGFTFAKIGQADPIVQFK